MATGIAYRVINVPGEVLVVSNGSATNPSIVFGDPNALGGMNDGLYGTGGPGVGISINGTSVATWTASGLATGAIATSGSILSSSPTAGLGYSTGAGGAVTQGTSKSEGVTLNTVTGAITMNNAALAAGVTVSFTVTNSAIDADDVVIVQHSSAGTADRYIVQANSITAGSFDIHVHNVGATSLSEAIVLSYAILKGVAA